MNRRQKKASIREWNERAMTTAAARKKRGTSVESHDDVVQEEHKEQAELKTLARLERHSDSRGEEDPDSPRSARLRVEEVLGYVLLGPFFGEIV